MLMAPGRAPPILTQQRRRARPIVAFARQPGPKTPAPELMSSAPRIGPFTITSGATASVVPDTPSRQNRSSQTASTAASTTGRYSGRQPAITALTAIFSTVARPKLGGISATSSSRERPEAATAAATRAAVGGTAGSPSVTPRAKRSSIGSSPLARRLARAGEGRAILEPLADLVQQPLHRERLGEEGVDRDEHAGVADHLGGPARHEDRLRVRAHDEEPVRQLLAVDTRHHDVGDEHVDRALVIVRDPERLVAVLGLEHLIARPQQDVPRQGSDLCFVVDHQDGLHLRSHSTSVGRVFGPRVAASCTNHEAPRWFPGSPTLTVWQVQT